MNETPTVATAVASSDGLTELWSDLSFAVRRSVRYHTHRRKFFDGLDTLFCFLVIICGGGALTTAFSPGGNRIVAAITGGAMAILGSLDLAIGFSTRARDHHDLSREFSELERWIIRVGNQPTWDDYTEMHNRRLEIEEEEPPVKKSLNCYCHNEMCRAMGKPDDEFVDMKWYHTWFKQVLDLYPSELIKFKDKKNELPKS